MALKGQVSNVYGVGLRNVGSYQVSGTPWVTGSAIANTIVQEHDLPTVSKSFTFINTGGHDLLVHFASGSTNISNGSGAFVSSSNYFANNHFITVASKASVTFDVKCRFIYISNNSGNAGAYELFAELTNIPSARMYELTGSGITA